MDGKHFWLGTKYCRKSSMVRRLWHKLSHKTMECPLKEKSFNCSKNCISSKDLTELFSNVFYSQNEHNRESVLHCLSELIHLSVEKVRLILARNIEFPQYFA